MTTEQKAENYDRITSLLASAGYIKKNAHYATYSTVAEIVNKQANAADSNDGLRSLADKIEDVLYKNDLIKARMSINGMKMPRAEFLSNTVVEIINYYGRIKAGKEDSPAAKEYNKIVDVANELPRFFFNGDLAKSLDIYIKELLAGEKARLDNNNTYNRQLDEIRAAVFGCEQFQTHQQTIERINANRNYKVSLENYMSRFAGIVYGGYPRPADKQIVANDIAGQLEFAKNISVLIGAGCGGYTHKQLINKAEHAINKADYCELTDKCIAEIKAVLQDGGYPGELATGDRVTSFNNFVAGVRYFVEKAKQNGDLHNMLGSEYTFAKKLTQILGCNRSNSEEILDKAAQAKSHADKYVYASQSYKQCKHLLREYGYTDNLDTWEDLTAAVKMLVELRNPTRKYIQTKLNQAGYDFSDGVGTHNMFDQVANDKKELTRVKHENAALSVKYTELLNEPGPRCSSGWLRGKLNEIGFEIAEGADMSFILGLIAYAKKNSDAYINHFQRATPQESGKEDAYRLRESIIGILQSTDFLSKGGMKFPNSAIINSLYKVVGLAMKYQDTQATLDKCRASKKELIEQLQNAGYNHTVAAGGPSAWLQVLIDDAEQAFKDRDSVKDEVNGLRELRANVIKTLGLAGASSNGLILSVLKSLKDLSVDKGDAKYLETALAMVRECAELADQYQTRLYAKGNVKGGKAAGKLADLFNSRAIVLTAEIDTTNTLHCHPKTVSYVETPLSNVSDLSQAPKHSPVMHNGKLVEWIGSECENYPTRKVEKFFVQLEGNIKVYITKEKYHFYRDYMGAMDKPFDGTINWAADPKTVSSCTDGEFSLSGQLICYKGYRSKVVEAIMIDRSNKYHPERHYAVFTDGTRQEITEKAYLFLSEQLTKFRK